MNKKSKALVGAFGATAATAAIAMTGSTGAFFYDNDTSTNEFAAGTLDLEYTIAPGTGASASDLDGSNIDLSNMKPGDTKSFTVTVKNAGSVAGYLYADAVEVTDDENVVWDAEGSDVTSDGGELDEAILIAGPGVPANKTLADMVPVAPLGGVALAPGDSRSATFTFSIPEGERGDYNDIMSDLYEFTLEMGLSQQPLSDLADGSL